MNITADMVKILRDKTGAGMMDCKKALQESEGDMEKAIDYLRKKGAATAEKRMDRAAHEGVVLTKIDNGRGIIVEINCETDFVARSADFLGFAGNALAIIETKEPADVAGLLELEHEGKKLSDHLLEAIGKIGEKIEVKRFASVRTPHMLIDYIHPGSKLGVMVELAATPNDQVQQLGKDLAMQVAAMNPVAVDRGSVSAETQEKELEIYRQQAREQGKPEAMLDKIAQGKLNKFFQDFTLLEQTFIRDNTKTVKEHIDDVGKSVGQQISVVRFERFQIGEAQ
jgi:elongation factor Ts